MLTYVRSPTLSLVAAVGIRCEWCTDHPFQRTHPRAADYEIAPTACIAVRSPPSRRWKCSYVRSRTTAYQDELQPELQPRGVYGDQRREWQGGSPSASWSWLGWTRSTIWWD